MGETTMKNRIKELRLKANLSQEQLAKHFKCTRQQIYYLEKDQRRVSPDMMHKLALFFGVSADFLMGWDDTGNYVPQMYMSIKEAQEYCGFKSAQSFKEFINNGLPVIVVGKSKRISKIDLEEFIEEHKVVHSNEKSN